MAPDLFLSATRPSSPSIPLLFTEIPERGRVLSDIPWMRRMLQHPDVEDVGLSRRSHLNVVRVLPCNVSNTNVCADIYRSGPNNGSIVTRRCTTRFDLCEFLSRRAVLTEDAAVWTLVETAFGINAAALPSLLAQSGSAATTGRCLRCGLNKPLFFGATRSAFRALDSNQPLALGT